MRPIGLLMTEHRLIERMIGFLGAEAARARSTGRLDTAFVDTAVDFLRTYADKCHHGKEEAILFRDAAAKPLAPEHRRVLDELLGGHTFARAHVAGLVAARNRVAAGDAPAADDAAAHAEALVAFYPVHIHLEDDVFFPASMEYFSDEELDAMTAAFREYDQRMIHLKYAAVVEACEHAPAAPPQ